MLCETLKLLPMSRMLDLHLERLADVAGAEPEQGHFRPVAYQQPIKGDLEVRELCFRYAEGEPFVLRDINLNVQTTNPKCA